MKASSSSYSSPDAAFPLPGPTAGLAASPLDVSAAEGAATASSASARRNCDLSADSPEDRFEDLASPPDSPCAGLEFPPEAMRAWGYRVIDTLVDHWTQLRELPTTRLAPASELATRLHAPLPDSPQAFEEVLAELRDPVLKNIGLTTHPRFFAFVPSPSNFVSVMGDLLANGFNIFGGNRLEAAGPSQIEDLVIDWLRQICGLPQGAAGVLVSGGSAANLTALAAARRAKLSGDRHSQQPQALAAARIYGSDQVHSSVERALRVLGFAPQQFVRLPSDEQFRLPVGRLKAQIAADRAAGLRPFCVAANAGATNTGAVDPLPQLVELCRQEDLWLHVDGAYGAPAILTEEGRARLAGLGDVDSLSLDPHKWLFQPYEIGCVLVREGARLPQAFAMSAEYLQDISRAGPEANYQDLGLQLTRSARAIKLWMSLKVFGMAAFRAAIERGLASARYVARRVEESPELELMTGPQLAIVTFRYRPTGAMEAEIDAANQRIVDRMLEDGFATVTSTLLRGRRVLRMCTINPRTTPADLDGTLERIVRFGREG